MKALVYLGPGRMELWDAPEPTPGPGEVVIASRASSICGSDLHGFREASPRRIPPLIMGHETVGTIASVGDGVPESRIGERVVLKPIVSCGACRWCREGAINHCPTGRLVGRDLTGGFAERFAVPGRRRRAVRRGRLGRGRDAHRAARERRARGVAGRDAGRPRLRDRGRADRRADGEGRAVVRGVARADHRPGRGPAAPGRGPGRGGSDRRRPGAGRDRRHRRRGRRRGHRRRRLRGDVGHGAPRGSVGRADRRGRAWARGPAPWTSSPCSARRRRSPARTHGATPTSPARSSS